MTKTYSAKNPEVWDKTSSAAANFIALQALMNKPESQAGCCQLLNLIDEIVLALLQAKDLIDPLPPEPPETERELAPVNHTEILKNL